MRSRNGVPKWGLVMVHYDAVLGIWRGVTHARRGWAGPLVKVGFRSWRWEHFISRSVWGAVCAE